MFVTISIGRDVSICVTAFSFPLVRPTFTILAYYILSMLMNSLFKAAILMVCPLLVSSVRDTPSIMLIFGGALGAVL